VGHSRHFGHGLGLPLYPQEADIRLRRNIRRRDYTTARNSAALAMAQAVSNRLSLLPAINSPGVKVG